MRAKRRAPRDRKDVRLTIVATRFIAYPSASDLVRRVVLREHAQRDAPPVRHDAGGDVTHGATPPVTLVARASGVRTASRSGVCRCVQFGPSAALRAFTASSRAGESECVVQFKRISPTKVSLSLSLLLLSSFSPLSLSPPSLLFLSLSVVSLSLLSYLARKRFIRPNEIASQVLFVVEHGTFCLFL